jgi:hypothetical protein
MGMNVMMGVFFVYIWALSRGDGLQFSGRLTAPSIPKCRVFSLGRLKREHDGGMVRSNTRCRAEMRKDSDREYGVDMYVI